MGHPAKSVLGDEVEARSKALTPLDRLKAMAGFMRNKQAGALPTLLLTTRLADAPPPAYAGPSVLSTSVEMTGSLNSPGELHIYGVVNADIRTVNLTIFAGGSLKGDVVAETVVVRGSFEGRIHANRIQLCAGAVVRGDLVYASLDVDAASRFEGVSKRSENPAAEADGGDVRWLVARAATA